MRPRYHHQYSSAYSHPLPIERRTSVFPYILAGILLALCGFALWWMLAAQNPLAIFGRSDAPTISNRTIMLELSGQRFAIPENYLRTSEQRTGGVVNQIDLQTIWPSMSGFNDSEADDFRDKSDTSRVLYITLTAPAQVWRPAERFYQVYPYYFAGPEEDARYGLKQRRMDDGSGLGDHDVLYHQGTDSFHLFHCLRDTSELMPADCVADKVVEPRILARYRFRRAMLVDWQEIDEAVEHLLARFAAR